MTEKATLDTKSILEKLSILKQNVIDDIDVKENEKIKCFISVGYKHSRAVVFAGVGNTKDSAFKSAQDRALKFIKTQGAEPPWLKLDVVTMEKSLTIDEFLSLASLIKKFYFKYGISFDEMYNNAFLHQEVNAGALIKYSDSEKLAPKPNVEIAELVGRSYDATSRQVKAEINYTNINTYLRTVRGQVPTISGTDVTEIIIFETKSWFFDEEQLFEMDDEELCISRRKIDNLSADMTKDLLVKISRYLISTVEDNGRFIYGYFSCYNKVISTYNCVRHALGVYSLCETYLVTKDEELLEPIKKSFKYLIEKFIYEVDEYAFVVEFESSKEIKLGALGVTILAIAKYLEIFDEKDEYLPLLQRIGNAICYMQNPVTGQFTHVLRYPDLEVIEKFRIVYYSGEAAFALMRIYALDKNERWLKTVHKAFDYFIQHNYWRNYDHWLAYCTNELTAISPDDRYFEFGLKNAFSNLDFIEKRITTWATFLEMLTASNTMIKNIYANDKSYLLENYDVNRLYRVMKIRAERLLDGIFFPEHAMYFKSPETILYGSFIRHHTFRVRNDDVAHHLSGYCHYLTDVLEGLGEEGQL